MRAKWWNSDGKVMGETKNDAEVMGKLRKVKDRWCAFDGEMIHFMIGEWLLKCGEVICKCGKVVQSAA